MNNLKKYLQYIGLISVLILIFQDLMEYLPIFLKGINYLIESNDKTKDFFQESFYVYRQFSAFFNVSTLMLTFFAIINWCELRFWTYVGLCISLIIFYLIPRIYYSLEFHGSWYQISSLVLSIVALGAGMIRHEHA